MTANREQRVQSQEDSRVAKATPLPKVQLFIALSIQFAEPITALVIYPFINQFIRDSGINQGDEAMTGYYAGLIESAFFLTECLSVVQWGYLSDRIGRRPVLLVGPLGLAMSATLFGLSSSFPKLVLFRCLQGIFNGNIGVAKTVMAEITDDTNIEAAYAYIPLMWSAGSTIAPFLGGVLSKPAERWSDAFGSIEFLRTHPYFLPCATAAFIAFCTFLVTFFGLKETLPSLVGHQIIKTLPAPATSATPLLGTLPSTTYGSVDYDNTLPSETQTTTVTADVQSRSSGSSILLYRPLLLLYLNYIFLAFSDMCCAVLQPLMYSTPIEYGGLGLQPVHIGTVLGTFGFLNALAMTQVFGPMVRGFGLVRLYQLGFVSLGCSFLVFPIASFFATRAGHVDAAVLICLAVQFVLESMVYMAFGTMYVLIPQTLPEGGPLGTANGIGQMLASGMRTIAPTVASSLFAVSKQHDLLGGNLCFYLLFGICIIGAPASLLIIEPAILKEEKRARESDNGRI